MRRLKSHQETKAQEEEECPAATTAAATAATAPWCVDCDQPLEPDQEEYEMTRRIIFGYNNNIKIC